jgi:ParB family transcriptional regulator, chromosome partitioning protein
MSGTPKRGLGRGFESLLPADYAKTNLLLTPEDRIEQVPVSSIEPNPHQPRHHFDDTALHELAASIKQYGVIQPIVVSPAKGGKYTLIAGERRWRASQLAKLTHVPAILRTGKELERLEVALLENVQRVDLSPLEQALSIERWHQQFSVAYETIAKRLGKAPSTINNIVRLLQLPEAARVALEQGQISEGHARAILALKDYPEQQTHLLEAILANGWSVRQAERYVTGVKSGASDKQEAKERVENETPATKALSKKIGTPVTIKRTARGGKLEIAFKSDEELDNLLKFLDK